MFSSDYFFQVSYLNGTSILEIFGVHVQLKGLWCTLSCRQLPRQRASLQQLLSLLQQLQVNQYQCASTSAMYDICGGFLTMFSKVFSYSLAGKAA